MGTNGVGGCCRNMFNLTVFYAILGVSENVTEWGIKMYGECYEDVNSFKSNLLCVVCFVFFSLTV